MGLLTSNFNKSVFFIFSRSSIQFLGSSQTPTPLLSPSSFFLLCHPHCCCWLSSFGGKCSLPIEEVIPRWWYCCSAKITYEIAFSSNLSTNCGCPQPPPKTPLFLVKCRLQIACAWSQNFLDFYQTPLILSHQLSSLQSKLWMTSVYSSKTYHCLIDCNAHLMRPRSRPKLFSILIRSCWLIGLNHNGRSNRSSTLYAHNMLLRRMGRRNFGSPQRTPTLLITN